MYSRIFTFLWLVCLSCFAFGQEIKIDDIRYRLLPGEKACVIAGVYKGHITVPASIRYQNKQYAVEEIGYEAFKGSAGLVSVKLPSSVHTVHGRAFENCTDLVSVQLPVSLTRLAQAVFSNCSRLEVLHIPSKVATIGEAAFADCRALKRFEVAADNQHFTAVDGVLYSKDTATLLKLPDTRAVYTFPRAVRRFLPEAFQYNRHITDIVLPPGIAEIPNHAFVNCTALREFKVPAAVASIGLSAFSGCTALDAFLVEKGNLQYVAVDGVLYSADTTVLVKCPEVKTAITIPNSVAHIGSLAFSDCIQLKTVTLPAKVSSIGMSAFVKCTALETVKLLSDHPVVIQTGAFAGLGQSVTILVPEKLLSSYTTTLDLEIRSLQYKAY